MLRIGPWAINAIIIIIINEGHISGKDQEFETYLFNLTSKLFPVLCPMAICLKGLAYSRFPLAS